MLTDKLTGGIEGMREALKWTRDDLTGEYHSKCGRFRVGRYHDERDNFYVLYVDGAEHREFRNDMEAAFGAAQALTSAPIAQEPSREQ